MIKKTIAMLMLAGSAHAGEFFTGYFYIIGAIPATVPADTQEDFAKYAFRARARELSEAWTTECGTPVFAWHTNLMFSSEVPFAPDMWVGILEEGTTREGLAALMPDFPCATQGNVRAGNMVIPSSFQYCAFNEGTPDYNPETCD